VAVQTGIDERIQELVAARRDDLAELVHQAVDRELAELVELELRNRNGNGHIRPEPPPADSPPDGIRISSADPVTKACNRCQLEKPVGDYETGRNTCRACRREQERERAHRSTAEEPPRS
jgi:hypothetical protein